MRSFWNGALRFAGMVVPVGLAPAVRSTAPRFELVHAGRCGRRLSSTLTCEKHGALKDAQVARAYVVGDARVQVAPAELESVVPKESAEIRVRCSVDRADVDPVLLGARYHLLPSAGEPGKSVYAIAREGLGNTHLLVCSLVVRGHEWNAVVGATERLMFLVRLHDVDDLVSVKQAPARSATSPDARLAVANVRQAVLEASRPRLPASALRTPSRRRLGKLLESKLVVPEAD